MYNSQDLTLNIKNQARKRDVFIRDMLNDCNLNINTISQITDKKGLSCFSLAKIADYLNCSVDYLLGRTDCPDMVVLNDEGVPVIVEAIKSQEKE